MADYLSGFKNSIFWITLVLSLLVVISPVSAQYFTIERFNTEIKIIKDGSFTVTETIEVTYDRERHGIYRELPYEYIDELGDIKTTPLKVLSVRDEDGKKWPYKITSQGGFVNIRIGDPDRYVRGRQVYIITYRVERGLLFFDDHDELYWNVTGNEWKAPIKSVSAEIIMDVGRDVTDFFGSCYTGYYGSNESECDWQAEDNKAIFSCHKYLGIGEGFTVALGWDKGIIPPPTAWQKFWWALNLKENWVYLIPPLVLIFMVFRWLSKGRDPRVKEAVTVMYEPPKFEGKYLSPGEAGTLVDERMDQRDITASVISLAVKGYIKIEEVKVEGLISLLDRTDYKLLTVKKADDGLDPFERQLFDDIFAGHGESIMISELKNEFYKKISSLKRTIYKQLVDKKYFPANPEKIMAKYVMWGFLIIIFGAFLSFLLLPFAPWKGIISFGLSGLIILLFARVMPVKTRTGALAGLEIRGFQEFLRRADKDRLERMPEKDLFYKYLPYAMALDVVDNWAEAFKDIYQEPPQWFVASHGLTRFNTKSFAHSLRAATATMGSTMYSAPRGSGTSRGGGGGGFSGGGGGGGGGGSW